MQSGICTRRTSLGARYRIQWVSHHDRRYFDEPEAYRPERWNDGSLSVRLPRYAYFPFGGGLRTCIGNSLTMTQMVAVVASIIHRCDMTLAPDAQVQPYPALVLRPLGVRMSVAPRRSK